MVKHTCDTLRLLCPDDIEDLIDFEIDRPTFATYLEEAGVLLKVDSKPMNKLRDLAFRITSALSTLITWDDIYRTLDIDHKVSHHLRWLDLPMSEILHGSLATDLTREGIIVPCADRYIYCRLIAVVVYSKAKFSPEVEKTGSDSFCERKLLMR